MSVKAVQRGAYLALLAMASMSGVVQGAPLLKQVQGTILVDRGDGYAMAHNGMVLRPGDRLFIMEHAHAVVSHGDGCVTPLQQNSLWVLGPESPCASGTPEVRPSGPHFAAAIGIVKPKTSTDAGEQAPKEVVDERVSEPASKAKTTATTSTSSTATGATAVGAGAAQSSLAIWGGVIGGSVGLGLALGGGGGSGGGDPAPDLSPQ